MVGQENELKIDAGECVNFISCNKESNISYLHTNKQVIPIEHRCLLNLIADIDLTHSLKANEYGYAVIPELNIKYEGDIIYLE